MSRWAALFATLSGSRDTVDTMRHSDRALPRVSQSAHCVAPPCAHERGCERRWAHASTVSQSVHCVTPAYEGCCECGEPIYEQLPTSWGGRLVHRACGEAARRRAVTELGYAVSARDERKV
jgi:hypothetical protein